MADETAGIRMLVVEDDKALSENVCEELRERGHMAVAAETVADGLDQLKQSEFEVALVDLTLPDGSGLDILTRISEEGLATEAIVLAGDLVNGGGLPAKARVDALHVAMAAVHGMDFLLTWNCKHIANAATRGIIEDLCRAAGFEPPIICTPLELPKD